MSIIAKHLTMKGRVQGVYYRGWTVETATSLGLTGWVRNRMNGDVEAIIQGEFEAVERMMALVWSGPPAARVDEVLIEDRVLTELVKFDQYPTL